jgi:hypothetical protein
MRGTPEQSSVPFHLARIAPYVQAAILIGRAGYFGITERKLQRAADKLGALKRKNGFGGGWEWGFAMSASAVAGMFGPLLDQSSDLRSYRCGPYFWRCTQMRFAMAVRTDRDRVFDYIGPLRGDGQYALGSGGPFPFVHRKLRRS